MYQLDIFMTHTVNSAAGTFAVLDFLMIWISAAGVPLLVVLVAVQWWRRDDRQHVRHAVVTAGLSFLLALGINQLILLFIHRPRPYNSGVTHLLMPPSADWSFPSDHATATMAIAAAFLLHRLPRTGVFFLLAALVTMVSRVYVGTHYVSDVLAGALTGLVGALIVWKLYREGTRVDRLVTSIL